MISSTCRAVAAATLLGIAPAGAQEEVFGSGIGVYNIAPHDMAAAGGSWANFFLAPNGAASALNANTDLTLSGPIHLDSGAVLVSATIFFNDLNGVSDVQGNFYRADTTGGVTNLGVVAFPSGTGGDQNVSFTFPAGTVVDNRLHHYGFNITLTNTGGFGNERFYRARIHYRRQVSAPPAVATFPVDVPSTHPFFRFVEAMAASGLTSGCAPGQFCPDAAVTRGQLAVFLATALGLHFPD